MFQLICFCLPSIIYSKPDIHFSLLFTPPQYQYTCEWIFKSPCFLPHPINKNMLLLPYTYIQISFTSTPPPPPPPYRGTCCPLFFSALAPSLLTVKTLPCHTRRFGMRTMRGDHPGAGEEPRLWLHCGRIGATQTYTLRAGSIQRSALAYKSFFFPHL